MLIKKILQNLQRQQAKSRIVKCTGQLTKSNHFAFIKEKDIRQIKDQYRNKEHNGKTPLYRLPRMYSRILALMFKESFQAFKEDLIAFKQIKSKNKQISAQDKERLMKILDDFRKCIGPILVSILPMGAPLVLLYIYKFPDFTPSWIIIDNVYQKLITQRKKRRKDAFQYFRSNRPEIIDPATKQINLMEISLQQLKKISQLCFGYYYDGTIIINRLFSSKFGYFLSLSVSKYIVLDKMAKIIERNFVIQEQIKDMCVWQFILWKIKKSVKEIQAEEQAIGVQKDQQVPKIQ